MTGSSASALLSERLYVVGDILLTQNFTIQVSNIPHSNEAQVHIQILTKLAFV